MRSRPTSAASFLGLFIFARLFAQSGTGELRIAVRDAAGAGISASLELVNEATSTRQSVDLPPDGHYSFRSLPFGFYRLSAKRSGFAPSSDLIEIRSAVPQVHIVTMTVEPLKTALSVTDYDTLIDPNRTDSANYVGSAEIEDRPAGLPGRGLLDLVAMQPGWTFEANGILHPRESEYDTQFVINGFPVYDNRSPAFAPTVDADNVESMKIYAGGIPAEFGQKLGGVIEVNTERNSSPGFHGTAVVQGGSFGTAGGFLSGQYVAGRTTGTISAEGFLTDHYLDPPVTQNFTNHASNTSFTGSLERDLTDSDRLRISMVRRAVWFLVPDDLLQQAAGQRQDRTIDDTEGQVYYQHVFSPSILGSVGGMLRDVTARLWSNPLSTPISAEQDRGYREGYLKGNLSGHQGRHEWKVGVEARFASSNEQFGYRIIDYEVNGVPIFDDDTPPLFQFRGHSPDREQAIYAQDMIRLGDFTVSAGLRFDHYSLLVDETAWSPRLAVSWHSKPLGTILHASYDRTFGTPPFENLLVSASPATAALSGGFYLPLHPSRGNYYEGGFTQPFAKRVRLNASYFRRDVRDFEDDDLIFNTGVSFPIAFHKATVRGAEVKLEVPHWGPFSGYLSYANTTGIAQFPITGGLFLDEDAGDLLTSNEKFPISQDQRNAARGWLHYQIAPRLWTAWSATYSSGLPMEDADELPDVSFLIDQFGAQVVNKVNFSRGRVSPTFALNASVGVDLWRREKRSVSAQFDALNLTDRLNVINFAGLLSGTAIAPPRSYGVRLRFDF